MRSISLNLNIFYCLNNNKRIRHKFFNLVLSSPYTYNIQYDKHYYYISSLKFSHEDMKQKCSNKAECDNVIPLKVTNQTDPCIKKNGDTDSIYIYIYIILKDYLPYRTVQSF